MKRQRKFENISQDIKFLLEYGNKENFCELVEELNKKGKSYILNAMFDKVYSLGVNRRKEVLCSRVLDIKAKSIWQNIVTCAGGGVYLKIC